MAVTPELIADSKRPQHIRISPDGESVVYTLSPQCRTQKGLVSSLWRAAMGRANSSRQITPGTFHDVSPEFSPDGRYISFISDRSHAGTASTIFLLQADQDEEAQPLTPTTNTKPIGSYQWAPDARSVAFISADEDSEETKEKRRNGDDAQVWGEDWGHARLRLIKVEDGAVTTLVREQAHVASLAWSADGYSLAYTLLKSPATEHMLDGGDIYIVNVQSQATRKVHHYTTWIHDLNWIEDDLAWVGVQDGETLWSSDAVWQWTASTGQAARRAYGESSCAQALRRCGQHLVVHVHSGLKDVLDAFSGKGIFSGGWDISAGWDVHDDRRLAVFKGSASSAEVVSIIDGEQVQLSSHANIPSSALSYTTVAIETQAPDGLPLDGMVYIPAHGRKPYPAVVLSHGGPYDRVTEGTDPTLFSWTPWLLSLGYAVLVPNYRGGSGHGASYAEAVIGDPSVSHQDVVAFTQLCIDRHGIDGRRVVAAGWSQGGYLAYLALTRHDTFPFAAAIAGAGVSCWDTLVLTSDVPTYQGALTGALSWAKLLYAGSAGRLSPIRHLDGVSAPLLIVGGEDDARVPVSQARSMHLALRSRGHSPEMVIYPREGHGDGGDWERPHLVHMLHTIEAFLRKHVPQHA